MYLNTDVFGVIEILIALEFGPFMLQRPEESFCNRIVITAPISAHRAGDLKSSRELLEGLASYWPHGSLCRSSVPA